jgi:hypothetical protein
VEIKKDLKDFKTKSRLVDLERKYKEALREIDRLTKVNLIESLFSDTSKVLLPNDFHIKVTTPSDAIANLCLGDWHTDETIDPAKINGINEFNAKICTERVQKLLNSTSEIIDMCRSKSNIETLYVHLLGDFMSGTIHEDLMETSKKSPISAALTVYELLLGVFNYLLKDQSLKNIVVTCVCGNHARITPKIRVKTFNGNNLEYMIYHLLAKYYEGNKRIYFQIPEGYFSIINLFGFKVRSSHGHYLNYKDGIGGVTIPLNKAISQWSKAIKVDLDILGHWHQRITMPEFVLNGCLIGYSEFAEKCKAKPEPPSQSFFLTTQKYVKTTEVPIYL